MARKDCDVLIIGSGFGGSVCALRAAEAGLRVIVLERGPRLTERWMESLAAGRAWPLRGSHSAGPFDLVRAPGLTAVVGSAVGGGSQIYTAVTIRPRAEAFTRDWPEAVTFDSLSPHYDRAEAMIAPSPVPLTLPRTAAMERAAAAMNATATRLPLAMDWPSKPEALRASPPFGGLGGETAAWITGGHAVRKRSLDRTYLREAEARGAEVRPLHEVRGIEATDGGYAVHYQHAQRSGDGGGAVGSAAEQAGVLRARRVILAAGAINTVRLLLACRDVHGTLPGVGPALGEGFYTNGDDGGLLIGGQVPAQRDAGPRVTAWLDLRDRDGLVLMDLGLLPPLPWLAARTLRRLLGSRAVGEAGRTAWLMGVMGMDRSRLTLSRRDRKLKCRREANDGAYVDRARDRLHQLAEAMEASLVLPPAALAPPGSLTVHAMGGARMADDPAAGVADGFGRVHGCRGLYIADASLVCGPLGAPPSLTVAALAEHAMERLLRE